MSEEPQIIFWQNTLSIHQSALIRNLAASARVTLVAEEDVYGERARMGWFRPDFGQADVLVAPDRDRILELSRYSGAAHIFAGIGAYPLVNTAMAECAQSGALMAMQSEAADWRGPLVIPRLLRGRRYARQYGGRLSLQLAIGHLAREWFHRIGLPDERTVPFAYFTEAPQNQPAPPDHEEARFIAIAQLVALKGLDILLRALGRTPGRWSLTIVGDGPERPRLQRSAAARGLSDKVRFTGSVPNEDAMRMLEQSDALILPSRCDGWGAVVNEALMRGVPVVCSSFCGASDLIVSPELGAVYPWYSARALAEELIRRAAGGPVGLQQRQRIRNWARCISGQSASEYLLGLLEAVRTSGKAPEAPWLAAGGAGSVAPAF